MFVYPLGEYVHRITFCTTLSILEINFKQKQTNLAISEPPRGEDQFTIGYKLEREMQVAMYLAINRIRLLLEGD